MFQQQNNQQDDLFTLNTPLSNRHKTNSDKNKYVIVDEDPELRG